MAESGNATACEGRDLPWLQDTDTPAQAIEWGNAYRDVAIVDGNNMQVDVFNLTENDLTDPINYDELKRRLLSAAGE